MSWNFEVPIMNLTPSAISRTPVESCTPRTTGLGVYLPIRSMAPVAPITMKIPASQRLEAMIWEALKPMAMAYAPTTFIGWTGTVTPK